MINYVDMPMMTGFDLDPFQEVDSFFGDDGLMGFSDGGRNLGRMMRDTRQKMEQAMNIDMNDLEK